MGDFKGVITTPSTGYQASITEINDQIVGLTARAILDLTDNSSTANAIIATTILATTNAPGIVTLTAGMWFSWKPTVENTGAVTFKIDGMAAAVDVKANDGSDIAAGYFKVGSLHLLKFDGTYIVESDVGSSVIAGNRAPDCIFEERQSAGIDAGDSSTATADNRILNTEVRNERTDVSLNTSTGEITIGPGKWLLDWMAAIYGSGTATSELYNTTDSSSVTPGTAVQSGTADQPYSTGVALLDISTTKKFKLRTWATTGATDGLGKASNLGLTEVYSRVRITAIDESNDTFEGTPGGAINEPYEYDDVDNDETDPGQGKFKLDDDDPSAATEIYLSKYNGDLNPIDAMLNSLGAGTSGVKATLTIHVKDDRKSYARYTVGTITDNTGWFTLGVTWKDGPLTSIDDASAMQLAFDRTGDAGTANNTLATVVSTTEIGEDTDDLDAGSSGRNALPVATDNTGSYKINGIVPKATSELIVLTNVDTNSRNITLGDEASSSTAANRIHTGTGQDVTLEPGDSAILWYREAATRWYIVGTSFGRDKREAGSDEYKELGDADETLDETDGVVVESVLFTAGRTRTLPLAALCKSGQKLFYVDKVGALSDTNQAMFEPTGDDKINGAASIDISIKYTVWIFVTDGVSSWTAATAALAGPSSAVADNLASYSDTSGKKLKDSGLSLDTDGTMAADSDTKIPSQKAVNTRVNAVVSAWPCFRATKGGTDQTGVVSATQTAVTFGTVEIDNASKYNTTGSKWVPDAGIVFLEAAVAFTANVVDQQRYEIHILKNGSTVGSYNISASGTGSQSVRATAIVSVNGTDEITVIARGNGAGDKTISGLADFTYFQGFQLVRS